MGDIYALYRVAVPISSCSFTSGCQHSIAHMIWFTASTETINGHKPAIRRRAFLPADFSLGESHDNLDHDSLVTDRVRI